MELISVIVGMILNIILSVIIGNYYTDIPKTSIKIIDENIKMFKSHYDILLSSTLLIGFVVWISNFLAKKINKKIKK